MPKIKPAFTAALVIALGATDGYPAGCNAHIFPDGDFRADDGRPASMTGGELRDWRMDAEIAAALIDALGDGRKPILYDYEHRSLLGDSRAAGWIDRLVYVPGRGLFGHVDWVTDADREIAKRVWRYSSPYFAFDPKTGAVTKLISVALTNNPALVDLGAVMLAYQAALSGAAPIGTLADHFLTTAGSSPGSTHGGSDMPDVLAALTAERDGLKTQVAALTTERDAQASLVVALTTERDALTAKVAAAEQEKAQAALATEQKAKDDLITAACSGDKPLMTPAQAEAVKSLSVAELTKFIDTLKPVPLTNRQAGAGSQEGNHGLSAEQLAWCNRMGVTPEQFAEARKSQG